MKLTTALLLTACLQVSARGNAQQLTLTLKNAPLEKAFRSIRQQTGYLFVYDLQLLRVAKKVDLDVKDMSLSEVLDRCFKDQAFTYTIAEKTIVVKPRPAPLPAPPSSETGTPVPPEEIHGHITDAKGSPLQGVSIQNRRNRKGTSTGKDGSFTLQATVNDILQVSCVGYKSAAYKVTSLREPVTLSLEIEASALDEMVLIGYGASKRKDLTGSVSTVEGKDLQDVPFNTVDNALAGKAAGVQVTKTDGTPGGAVRIRVRGSTSLLGGNDPLYVVDGVPMQIQSSYKDPGYDVSNPIGNDISGYGGVSLGMSTAFVNGLNSLGGLNPDDIETVTILKDASSSAIYGSKAANGVVIITTKKGKRDMKPQITFNYNGTYNTIFRRPHVLDATQYKTLLTESAQNDNDVRDLIGEAHTAQADQIVKSPSTFFGTGNTDWIAAVTRKPFSHNAEIAVQGGAGSTRYYTSISFNRTPGVIIGTDYERMVGKINLETDISRKFKFISNFNIGNTNQNITNGAYDQALKARPDYTPLDSAGNFVNFSSVGTISRGFQNPVALLTATNNARSTSILGSLSLLYDILPGLQFKSTVSLNNQQYNQRTYTPSYVLIGSFYGSVANNGGIGNNANSRFTDWFVENTLSYTKNWKGIHAITLLGGTSYETTKTSYFSATATGYPNDNVLNGLSSAITPLVVEGDDPSKPQSYLLSYYLRANYTLKEKYLFTFTDRADGSSKFGPDNKYGYFPSGAIAWRLSKEPFLRNAAWLEDLKIRTSYGLTGNQNIGNQMYRTLYTPLSYAGNNALVPTQLGSSGIKWETSKQTDLGLDFTLFKGRLSGTFDYYKKQTDDALLSLPVPSSSSYPSLLGNVVGIRNKGQEFSLQGDILRTRDFRWNMSFNITWNKSIVSKLSTDADLSQVKSVTGLEYGNTTLIEGQPLGLITGMKVVGIIKTQKDLDDYKSKLGQEAPYFPTLGIGDPMFLLDTISYKAYNAAYPLFNTIIGSGAPKYYGGFTQSLSYKNFDLNLYFLFSQGGHLLWGDDVSSTTFVGTSNANAVILKRYTSSNTNSNRPRLLLNDQLLYNSNLSIYNSSYLKLRTATLNYRLDNSGWLKRNGFQGMAIYVSATNLFTITKYPGNDPETSDDSYSVAGGYFDVSNYAQVRTFSAGVKVSF